HDHLGHASVGQAAHEAGAAHVLLIDLEPEPRGQKHADRRDDAHEARLRIRGLEHDDGEPDIGAILGGHALDEPTLLALRGAPRVGAPRRPGAPGGVPRRPCQSLCTDFTAPCAAAGPLAAIMPKAAAATSDAKARRLNELMPFPPNFKPSQYCLLANPRPSD